MAIVVTGAPIIRTNANATSSAGDRPTLTARKRLTDDFRKRMLCDSPVQFYRQSEGYVTAARKAMRN